jgi:hypothetical protein
MEERQSQMSGSTLTLATYNMRKAVGLDRRRDPDRILAVLEEVGADIIALQEADRRTGGRASAVPHELWEGHGHWLPVPLGVKNRRALDRLLDGGLEGLAHLGRHEAAEGLLLRLMDLGGSQHSPCPLGERRRSVGAERIGRAPEARFDLVVGERLEGLKRLARRWIHGRYGHDLHLAGLESGAAGAPGTD